MFGIIFAGMMALTGYSFQETYEVCSDSVNKDHPSCEIFYKDECECEVKVCHKKLIEYVEFEE